MIEKDIQHQPLASICIHTTEGIHLTMAFLSPSYDISQLQMSTTKIKNKKAYAECANEEASLKLKRIKGYGSFLMTNRTSGIGYF